ncbi:MAG: aldo/keto reductase [FCB group bacterium]|jgi:predicted aldo/keto reductase-like oxidoreductase|nr:aldo/keto reductase [FCB group bacterium]
MNRRNFLQNATYATGLALWLGALGRSARAEDTRKGDMIYRTLGRTGEQVSLLGVGGYHIGIQPDEQESIRIIRGAMDAGVNFLDNSWGYNDGQSEIRMGKALKDGYREKAFLMTKVDGRTKASAARQLEESLKRLDVETIDLWQFHEIIRMEDADRIFAEGGGMEAALEAKKAGKIRYIGFTGHKDPAVHLRALEVAGQHGFTWDTVQMPLNVLDAHFRSFEKHVLPELLKQNIGVLGMKPLASGDILKAKVASPVECLHYAMTLPTSVVITGMDSMERLEQGLRAVRDFKPLDDTQLTALLERGAEAAATGQYEQFKTGTRFDATTHNPQWLG